MEELKKYLDLSYYDIKKLGGNEKDIAYSYWKKIQLGIYAPLRDLLIKQGYIFKVSIYKITIRELLNQLLSACDEAGISRNEQDVIINKLQEANESRKR